jgi:hypothetical protein
VASFLKPEHIISKPIHIPHFLSGFEMKFASSCSATGIAIIARDPTHVFSARTFWLAACKS